MSDLMQTLETQEIDGGLSTEQSSILLTLYFIENDLLNAKFLWKRIPDAVKESNVELAKVWSIGKKLWAKDFVACYAIINQEWSEPLRDFMAQLHESIKERLFRLISKAYTSIRVGDFAALIDAKVEDAIKVAVAKNWVYDATSQMLQPIVEHKEVKMVLNSEHQLQLLSEYISFLEN